MAEATQAASACVIALHVPTSSVQFGPDILDDEIPAAFKAPPPPRRPHPGGLDTLPEASHVNALAQATGPSPPSLQAAMANASLGRSNGKQQVESLLNAAMASLSAPSRSRAITRAKGYNSIAVQLANERWRERWTRLCLAPPESDPSSGPSSTPASSSNTSNYVAATTPSNPSSHTSNAVEPVSTGGSWELLAQASGAGGLNIPVDGTIGAKAGVGSGSLNKMIRSSSRKLLSDNTSPPAGTATSWATTDGADREQRNKPAGDTPFGSMPPISDLQTEAETWRKAPCFRPGEVNLSRYEDSDGVVAIVSPWIELDSIDEGIRLDSEIALRQELSYASHLGITHIILPPPSSDPACRPYLLDYARALAGCLVSRGAEAPAAGHFARLSIRLPISSPYMTAQAMLRSAGGGARPLSIASNSSNGTAQMRSEDDWSWQVWHVVQAVCAYNARLGVALDLSAPLPSPATLERWLSEPVSHVWLPARAFLSNAKGYPVLSKATQTFLRSMITVKAPSLGFVLVGTQAPPENHTRGGQAAYEQYVRHIERGVTSSMTETDMQVRGYGDYLQAPLQPLFDNLEGQTYATFEADSIKYDKYEEAVTQALATLSSKRTVVLWVCGAGRGPLVSRCIAAARRAARTVQIVALEKNPNAIVGLRERAATEWGQDVVRVEMGDMRTVAVPHEKADVIVSELLGSFGDNELSPECLDGAMRILKPNGICIPRAYSSYITPISTPKLFSEVSKGTPISTGLSAGNGMSWGDARVKAAETPYVVLLRSVSYVAARGGREDWPDVQHCWTFDHSAPAGVPVTSAGLPLTNAHNVRISAHTFHIPRQAVCHGFAGFFEAHLWGNVVLSIHPDPARATPGMLSWFPLYFPLRDAMFLSADSELDVSLWRMSSNDRVWYEWMAQSYLTTIKPTRATSMAMDTESGHTLQQQHQKQTSGGSAAAQRSNGGGGGGSSDGLLLPGGGPDAFQNAPNTPRLPNAQLPGDNGAPAERLMVSMSALMNPGGRSSSVHM